MNECKSHSVVWSFSVFDIQSLCGTTLFCLRWIIHGIPVKKLHIFTLGHLNFNVDIFIHNLTFIDCHIHRPCVKRFGNSLEVKKHDIQIKFSWGCCDGIQGHFRWTTSWGHFASCINCIMQLFIPKIHADLASHFAARHLIFPGPSHRREDLSTNKINALF